jgi:hypothetical protein
MASRKSASSSERPTYSVFRDWLIQKVALARWAVFLDETDEEAAKRLGVQVDVLKEANFVFKERIRRQRLPDGQRLGKRTVYGRKRKLYVFLEPPKAIYGEWAAHIARQGITQSTLLRSVVHLVLQSPTQPAWLGERRKRNWIFQGQWLGQDRIRNHEFRISATVSEGAERALRLRAENTHVTPSAIARWAVCLYVNGQLPKLQIVSAAHAMYRKPEQYVLEPKIV